MIFICGHHNTGKTTIAKELTKFSFFHIETGDVVRRLFKEQKSNLNFHEWATKINNETPHFFDKYILNIILKIQNSSKKDKNAKIIITGNRQLSGINYLINHNGYSLKNLIIYLDIDNNEELYKRQIKRKDRKLDNFNKESFINDYLEFDKKMGIDQIKDKADYIINSNMSKKKVMKDFFGILKLNNYNL